jgi:hypothetical protein
MNAVAAEQIKDQMNKNEQLMCANPFNHGLAHASNAHHHPHTSMNVDVHSYNSSDHNTVIFLSDYQVLDAMEAELRLAYKMVKNERRILKNKAITMHSSFRFRFHFHFPFCISISISILLKNQSIPILPISIFHFPFPFPFSISIFHFPFRSHFISFHFHFTSAHLISFPFSSSSSFSVVIFGRPGVKPF